MSLQKEVINLPTDIQWLDLDDIKRKVTGSSVVLSILIHGSIFGLVKFGQMFQGQAPATIEENYVDLGYETFDEVPLPQPQVTQSQEIQDEKSEIVGIQKKVDKPVETPTRSTATVADVPYYKIKPKYPKDALEAGVEGHVNLAVDVLEDGTVENIQVTGGDQLNLFEMAAKRAVAKWKYRPFLDESGSPIRKKSHLVRVDFKLTDEVVSN